MPNNPKIFISSFFIFLKSKFLINIFEEFFNFAIENNIQIQHILYSVEDLKLFKKAIELNVIPKKNLQVLYVLGRYDKHFQSKEENLDLFLDEHNNIISEIESFWILEINFGIANSSGPIPSRAERTPPNT